MLLFACPNCDERPQLVENGPFLVCPVCHRHYPIINGIPHLLPESGLSPEDAAKFEIAEP